VAALRRLAARSGSVLVSYWLAPGRSFAWVVGARAVRIVELPAAAEIDALVKQHQSAVANALSDPLRSQDSAGDRLYRLLVVPVVQSLEPGTSLIIVADGALHGLNFETLPVEGSVRHYFIEDAELQLAPSLALLAMEPAARRPERSLLLIGDPTPHEPEFPALRFASSEMTQIASHFDGRMVRTVAGADASPDSYRQAAPDQFSLVHFTSHAEANIESPLDSAVVLSGTDRFKLYARDVAALPLRADLVTVSACRGAGERAYSGEGLVGFAWAFLRAGARRVIAGLWDVDDRSTAELMNVLYARIAAGDTPARALRAAKLTLLRGGGAAARPYYWGPFQIFTVSL
jgi:CHAT domain-containing protein